VFHASARWGAARHAHTAHDVQSGIGEIGNCRGYDNAAKTVVYDPFMNPSHFEPPTTKKAALMYRFAWFGSRPGYFRLMGVLSAALLGW
jgi:hypothetical protein